jgi:uncharacterized protein involved in type VI secretion and phage assembly
MQNPQHAFCPPTALALGKVKDPADPQSRGRVQVTLIATNMDVWASCVAPSAGAHYGVALLPKRDEIVLVAFLSPDQAFVLGAVWSGRGAIHNDAEPNEDRYAIKTRKGVVLAFKDDDGPSFSVTTPGNNSITLTDSDNSCTVLIGGTTIKATPGGVTITTSASIEMDASSLTINAPSVTVNAASSQFSGVVQCDTLIASTVGGASYTPGAGNIW